MSALLNPTHGVRDIQARQGRTPKDHAKENVLAMRRAQQENRQRRAEKARKDSEPANAYKMPRFKGVEPRAVKQANAASSPPGGAKHSGYLRRTSVGSGVVLSPRSTMTNERHANTPAGRAAAAALSPRPYVSSKVTRKAAVPLTSQSSAKPVRAAKDFISQNAVDAISAKPPPTPEKKDSATSLHANFGAVPEYLQRRKVELAHAEEQRRAMQGDAECPPGMVRMDESERVETLRVMTASLAECKRKLQKLPLSSDTPSAIRRRNELEGKMKELEGAITIFSRPKVFVVND